MSGFSYYSLQKEAQSSGGRTKGIHVSCKVFSWWHQSFHEDRVLNDLSENNVALGIILLMHQKSVGFINHINRIKDKNMINSIDIANRSIEFNILSWLHKKISQKIRYRKNVLQSWWTNSEGKAWQPDFALQSYGGRKELASESCLLIILHITNKQNKPFSL